MSTDWQDALIAWLHDPPDKALNIQRHVSRAKRYLGAALKRAIENSELQHHADQVASAIERLPMPHWEASDLARVGAERMYRVHPLSGKRMDLPAERELHAEAIEAAIAELVDLVDSPQQRFFLLWRMLPERLAASGELYSRLPADTRVPDHSIWQHLDTTAALQVAWAGGRGAAFLCFSIGPVQQFIATARSVRDLWTGSMILSWLTFRAMLPVVEQLGPTAVAYPVLRGNPLMDLWLREEFGLGNIVPEPSEQLRKSPCLPNRFVALVPWGTEGQIAIELANRCEQSAREAWREVAQAVHRQLDPKLSPLDGQWDRRWDEQVDGFFDFRTALLPWHAADDGALVRLLAGKYPHEDEPFKDVFDDAHQVRRLAESIPAEHRPPYPQKTAGQWQYRMELALRSLAAQKTVRHFPQASQAEQVVPPKCSMMGSLEQMGPAGLAESATFWEKAVSKVSVGGVRLRPTERLCAVALVKRFAGPAFFSKKLGLGDSRKLRIDDTATISARRWLAQAQWKGFDLLDPERCRRELDTWSGQWLHAQKQPEEEGDSCPDQVWQQVQQARRHRDLGWPPAYYAVLVMDGDEMGRWLRGENAPRLSEVLHEDVREYFEQVLHDKTVLSARRPVTPALHAAISGALANFALHFVPNIVESERFAGTLIYAGGDDVLALLPTETALACARELYETFRQDWAEGGSNGRRRARMLMGQKATLTAGLAVVHYKEDLRFAMQQARNAEKAAKDAGRNAIQISICRRSGEHATALCPWSFAGVVEKWVEAFRNGASDRWAYHLRSELEVLCGLPPEAMAAEIRRQVNRAEEATRKKLLEELGEQSSLSAGDALAESFTKYSTLTTEGERLRFSSAAEALEQFVTLCQSASFLARGLAR